MSGAEEAVERSRTDPRINAALAAVDAAEAFLELLEDLNERRAVRFVTQIVSDTLGPMLPEEVEVLARRFAVEPAPPTPRIWDRLRGAIDAGDLDEARAVLVELDAAMARDLAPRGGH